MSRTHVLIGIDIPEPMDTSGQRRTVAEIIVILLRQALETHGLEAGVSAIALSPDDIERMTYALRKYAVCSEDERRELDDLLQNKLAEVQRAVDQIVAQRSKQ